MASSQYTYSSFPDASTHLRILTLLPFISSSSAEIEVRLETLRVEDAIKTEYQALSYAWGLPVLSETIYAGPDLQDSLNITSSLMGALQHLRLEMKPRRLWIDAICIDQRNLHERSKQVLLMPDIYTHAVEVIVWLGPETESTPLAFEIFEGLAHYIGFGELLQLKPTDAAIGDGQESWADENVELPLDGFDFLAVISILECPWFERLWVRQEIFFSKDKANVMCGHYSIPWSHLRSAVFALVQKPMIDPWQFFHKRRLTDRGLFVIRLDGAAIPRGMSDLLRDGFEFKCLDPRDRIFAALSMTSRDLRIPDCAADYTQTVGDTYKLFFQKHLSHHKNLSLLNSCDLESRLPSAPSWIANWHSGMAIMHRTAHKASGYSSSCARFIDENSLELGGVRVASVKSRIIVDTQTSSAEFPSKLRDIMPAQLDVLYPTGCSLFEAYCKAFCSGDTSERFLPPMKERGDLLAGITALKKILQEDYVSFSKAEVSYLRVVSVNMMYFAFIFTEEGYLGYGPTHTRSGDQVYAFLGMDNLLVLRPIDAGKFEVVGPAFLHGLMDSEGLLGPLPQHFEPVSAAVRSQTSRSYGFVNRDTGIFQIEDPRKGPVPQGWQEQRHESEDLFDCHVNTETGEVTRRHDPRLTFDYLVEHGVPTQKVILI